MKSATLVVAVLAALCGCAAGPDYQRPALALPHSYGALDDSRFAIGSAIQADWWTVFHAPALDALIAQALRSNQSIETADAALAAANEALAAQRAAWWPTVSAGYTPTRTKLAGNLGGNSPGVQGNGSVISTTQNSPASDGGTAPFNAPVIYSFHTAQLSVAYNPDVFGANRRQVESAEAQRQYQRFQLTAAALTVASNVAAAAFQDAVLRYQIGVQTQIIAAGEQAVALAQRQRQAGLISGVELAAQQAALAQAKQALPMLQKQAAQNRGVLRLLAGIAPDGALPGFDLADFTLPQRLPLSLPSALIEQRPDVQAAEAQLQAASAQVGIAHAARLPQLSLTGNVGGAASQFGQMFWSSGKFFDLTANLAQTLFDGGALKHRELAASQALRGAIASYRLTVASACQNVADVLQALETDGAAVQAADASLAAARAAAALTRRQHQYGALDGLALIAAEQNERAADAAQAQARAALLTDTAALFQALGGGWQGAPAPLHVSAKGNEHEQH